MGVIVQTHEILIHSLSPVCLPIARFAQMYFYHRVRIQTTCTLSLQKYSFSCLKLAPGEIPQRVNVLSALMQERCNDCRLGIAQRWASLGMCRLTLYPTHGAANVSQR